VRVEIILAVVTIPHAEDIAGSSAPNLLWTWWPKGKICPCRKSNLGRPVRGQSLYWL